MNMSEQQWCWKIMNQLRQEKMVAKKMYPAGRIIYIEDQQDIISLYQVSQVFFRELKLHPLTFDLSKHTPKRYESMLKKISALKHKQM
jgi:hypothetical protein